MAGHIEQRLIACGAVEFHRREFHPPLEIPLGAALQERVAKHRTQRGREREGQFHRHPFRHHPAKDFEQGNVAFDNRFEEPVLLEEVLVFRVAHPRQVGMQQEGKGTLVHMGVKELRAGTLCDKHADSTSYRQPGQIFSASNARPRWLRRFFISAPSSAKVSQ